MFGSFKKVFSAENWKYHVCEQSRITAVKCYNFSLCGFSLAHVGCHPYAYTSKLSFGQFVWDKKKTGLHPSVKQLSNNLTVP